MSSGDRSSYEDGSSDEELEGGNVESLEGRAGRDTSLEGDVELSSSVKETLNELGVSPEKNRKKKKKKKKKKSTTKDVGSGFCDEDEDETSSVEASGRRSRSPSDAVMVRRVSGICANNE